MKFQHLLILASATLLGGCASDFYKPQNSAVASNSGDESYVPLGSAIPRKGGKRTEDQTADLQQLENARTMGNANMNGAPLGR